MTVMSQLSTLESAGLIRLVQLEPELEYLFRHELVQNAAYASLLMTDRKRLHQAIGQAVEMLYSDRLDEYAGVLARHFQQAGDDRHALEYFVRAADAALASYANQEAESLYRSALTLPCSQAQRVVLLAGLGEALYCQSRFEEAIQTWRDGIDEYQVLGDDDGVAKQYARSARAVWHLGDHLAGLRLCQEGLEVVCGAPESAGLAILMHEAGRAYYFNGLPDEGRPLCQQALEMAERLGAIAVQADTLATLGVFTKDEPQEALSALTKAVELTEAAGLLEIGFRAHHNLGNIKRALLVDQRAAREHYVRAASLARQRGSAQEELFSLSVAVGMSLALGELEAVEEALPKLEGLAQAIPDPEQAQRGLHDIKATLLQARGEWAEAWRLRRESSEIARQRGDFQGVRDGTSSLAQFLLEMDRLGLFEDEEASAAALAEAEAALGEALQLTEGSLGGLVWMLSQLSMLRARQGQFDESHRLLSEAREESKLTPAVWNVQVLANAEGRLAAAEERWPEALTAFEAAAGAEARMGMRWSWARILLDWADAHVSRGQPADLERAQALLREARAAFEEMDSTYYASLVGERLQTLRAETFTQALALGVAAQELRVAGRIQEGLLPRELPHIPGWQLAAALEPARETSGDFYDFIPLPEGRWGIVVADVADKGAGAALYMALSRTLIRTFAAEHVTKPELVLAAANERILEETHIDMFVTVFYGILDPETGTLAYCNAGHHPPYVLSGRRSQALGRTGMALGVVQDTDWDSDTVQLAPEEILLLYTDGVTDAQSPDGKAFGQDRLLAAAQASLERAAPEVQENLLAGIRQFVQDAPQFDDLTLLVLKRT
jgi:tetratricopeptide (TPR) repeat protein